MENASANSYRPLGARQHRADAPVGELVSKLESLIKRAQDTGMLTDLGHIPSQAERLLTTEIRNTLPMIETALTSGTAAHIVRLYSLYDIAYRAAHKNGLTVEFQSRLFARAMTLWLGGDKSVGEEELIAMMQQVDRRYVDFRYIDWSLRVQDQWIKELESNGGRFRNLSFSATYQRLTALLRADLWLYYSTQEDTVKRDWIKANLLHDNISLSEIDKRYYKAFLMVARRYGSWLSI